MPTDRFILYIVPLLWFIEFAYPANAMAAHRFEGPCNENELKNRIEQLKDIYSPYLRSLPIKMDVRERKMLSGDEWKFTFNSKDFSPSSKISSDSAVPPTPNWHGEDFNDSQWHNISVPEWRYRTRGNDNAYDTKTIDQFTDYDGEHGATNAICWYRTKFKANRQPSGKRLWLCFDGVDGEAEVYLNGQLLGRHRVYYELFRFDVTDKMKEKNILAVRVIDGRDYGEPMTYWSIFPDIRAKEQRYVPDRSKSICGNLPIGYHCGTGFGIFRDVYLEETGPVLVSDVFARNDLSDGNASVKVELDSNVERDVELTVQILPENFDGPSFEKTFACNTPKGLSVESLTIPMPGANTWSPNAQNLYRCRVTVHEVERMADVQDVLLGCRSFTLVHHKNGIRTEHRTKYKLKRENKLGVKFRADDGVLPFKAQWLRIACRGSDDGEWNSIWEVTCPAFLPDKTNSVTASGKYQDYAASKAVDGKQWTVGNGREKLLHGKQQIDVPAIDVIKGDTIDLTPVTDKIQTFNLTLILTDSQDNMMSRYHRHVRCAPEILFKQ